MASPGSCSTSRSSSVVLPVPDGAETMNRMPRAVVAGASLDILHLLAQLLELRLRRDNQLRHPQPVGFRSHRVHFAIHLLQQEIELAAARLGAVGERAPVRDVGAE